METAAAAVSSLLPKLQQAYNLLLNHDGDQHQRDAAVLLSRELTSIHGALRDAAAAARAHASPEPDQPHDTNEQASSRAWAGAASELAYDVDDAIDALLVTPSPQPEPGRGHDDLPPPRSPISLQGLLQRATQLSSRIAVAGEGLPVPSATTVITQSDQDDDEAVLVGANGARDGLIRRLRLHGSEDDGEVNACDRKATTAVAIVGSAGLGKTALARSAYGVLQQLFDCAAFVSVGSHSRIESVLQSLLRQLGFTFTDDAAAAIQEQRDVRELVNQLVGFLQNKRYLIVVDDLWDTLSWDKIRCALIDNNRGSRIIATTCNFDVAEQVGTPYELKPLSAEDSRTLFFRTVFGHEDRMRYPDDDEFTKVAEKFSEKCSGVPLAIVTVAKVLASKMMGEEREWHKVGGYIGSSELENTPDVKKMRMVTSRGYYCLPPHLRACLLYMSVFPEGSEIRRGRLVWRWIAEGFVHFSEDENKKLESLFELGESYVDELVNRSMIQLLDVDYADGDDSGRDECCYSISFPVMDLISHLSSQETFTTVLDDDEQQQACSQIRRASFLGRSSKTEDSASPASISMPPRLRSLSVFSPGNAEKIDLSTAEFLRVLDLEGCDLSGDHSHLLQNHIGSLVHLRYLGLRDTRIASVPESIGKLRSLQTLDLADNTKVDELPASVVELGELMCLRVYYRTRVPAGIGRLTALEELSDVSTREAPDLVEELGRLTSLRVLRMTLWKPPSGRQEEEALLESLRRLRNIQVLDIYVSGAVGGGDPSQGRLDTVREAWAPPRRLREFHARAMNSFSSPLRVLPAWIDAPATPCLAVLVVQLLELRQRDVEALGRLPALRVLRVDPYATREPFVVPGGAFPRLTECRFRDSDLGPVFWRGAAPRLRRLEFCFRVRNTIDLGNDGFDFGLGNLEVLEEVAVYVGCQESTEPEAEAAEAALRAAANAHPNRANFDVVTFGEELMCFDDDN